jgi:hypothetical protein
VVAAKGLPIIELDARTVAADPGLLPSESGYIILHGVQLLLIGDAVPILMGGFQQLVSKDLTVGMLVRGSPEDIKALGRKGFGLIDLAELRQLVVAGVRHECMKEPTLLCQQVHRAPASGVRQGRDHPSGEHVVGDLELQGPIEQGQDCRAQSSVDDLKAREEGVLFNKHPDSLPEDRLRVVVERLELRFESVLGRQPELESDPVPYFVADSRPAARFRFHSPNIRHVPPDRGTARQP